MKCCTRRRPQAKSTLRLFFPALTSDVDGGRPTLETKRLELDRLHSSVFVIKTVIFVFYVVFVCFLGQAGLQK